MCTVYFLVNPIKMIPSHYLVKRELAVGMKAFKFCAEFVCITWNRSLSSNLCDEFTLVSSMYQYRYERSEKLKPNFYVGNFISETVPILNT